MLALISLAMTSADFGIVLRLHEDGSDIVHSCQIYHLSQMLGSWLLFVLHQRYLFQAVVPGEVGPGRMVHNEDPLLLGGEGLVESCVQGLQLLQIGLFIAAVIISIFRVHLYQAGADVLHLHGSVSQGCPDVRVHLASALLDDLDPF